MSFEDVLADLHDGMAKELLKRVKDGTATAADMNVALNLLKHNGVSAVPEANEPIKNLATALPFSDGKSTFN